MKYRYLKFILAGVAVLLCAAYILHFLREPKSEQEIFDKNYMNITPEKGTSSFNYYNVQSYHNRRYFQDEEGNLFAQKEGSENKELQIENVAGFLIKEDELVYTIWDEPDKVYIRSLKDSREKSILVQKAYLLFHDNEYAYIYSETNILYKFNRSWNMVKKIDLNEKGFRGCFERCYAAKGKFVFVTKLLQLYIYDEQKGILHEVRTPDEGEASKDGDVADWKGNVYYLLSYYDDGDLHNSLTRLNSTENGIYKLNTDKGELEKVSDETGESMLVMNNQLYIAKTHFWGLSYQIDCVDMG